MPEPHRERLAVRAAALALADPAAAAAWAPTVLDIGFGYGESLLELGLARPDERVLGVDVHSPGQLRAMDRLVGAGLESVRVLPSDVTNLLPLLAPGSLTLVQAFHPDPWPKRKHAIRRLLQPAVIARLAELLAADGVLHVVIDDDTYAASVREAAAAFGALSPVSPPDVPETKYGRRARAARRTVHDMAWTKV
jgi:tRNA (guanine-N7-)-methyltransferase